jgi:hypothetical protein
MVEHSVRRSQMESLTDLAAGYTKPDQLEKSGRQCEARCDFDGAAQHYLAASQLRRRLSRGLSDEARDHARKHVIKTLALAARSLEKAQNWRAHEAAWERVARDLATPGEFVDEARTNTLSGDHGIFHIISEVEWSAAPDQQKIAWAFQWSAEGAESAGQLVLAARCYRLAGLEFEELARSQTHEDSNAPRLFDEALSDPLREAARCCYRAALAALESREWATYRRVGGNWDVADLDWSHGGTEEKNVRELAEHQREGLVHTKDASDLGRLDGAWDRFIQTRQAEGRRVGRSDEVLRRDKSEALKEKRRQLVDVQIRLAERGERDEARKIYRKVQKLEIRVRDLERHPFRALGRRVTFGLSAGGSSLARLVTLAVVTYFAVFPLLFAAFDLVRPAQGKGLGLWDYVLFSASNIVTTRTVSFAVRAGPGEAVVALESISAYLVLGFAIWIALRNYSE